MEVHSFPNNSRRWQKFVRQMLLGASPLRWKIIKLECIRQNKKTTTWFERWRKWSKFEAGKTRSQSLKFSEILTAKDWKQSSVSFLPRVHWGESAWARRNVSPETEGGIEFGCEVRWEHTRAHTHKEMLTWQKWHCTRLNPRGCRRSTHKAARRVRIKKKKRLKKITKQHHI